MILEFKVNGDIGLLQAFAEILGTTVNDGILTIPESMGSGYLRGIDLGNQLKIMIRLYQLKDDFTFRRLGAGNINEMVVLAFHNFFSQKQNEPHSGPYIQIASAGMDSEIFLPANSKVDTIIIAVKKDLLEELLKPGPDDAFLQNIISGQQPYIYEQIISPEMHSVANGLINEQIPKELQHFHSRLQAEQLIYLLFSELLRNQRAAAYPLNVNDVKNIYTIRDQIIADLNISPNLPTLAIAAGMSESKMKRLFKQIFGNSIYSYYQSFRLKEAAYLIREKNMSVSEAGYKMGFSNLSHFTRIFERYIGQKPKKYSTTQEFLNLK
ncbi:AraC family transcriptional regulator [Pedobacter antarcticus]|uniref:helix-turn-helix transcriptional regulator n=1 Tax=Pedobacter antarcticus TaxID=34086 RepID=UPI00292ED569|nr:AraC family transcriptional regulator [Pedobacter antarcticus]